MFDSEEEASKVLEKVWKLFNYFYTCIKNFKYFVITDIVKNLKILKVLWKKLIIRSCIR